MSKTYTHTEEGKQVLRTLSNVILTFGMEVYKCNHCDDLYASKPEHHKGITDKPTCGICETELKHEFKDAYGLENAEDDFE